MGKIDNAPLLILIAASAAMLGAALVFQYMGYPPCKMCYWQRYPHAIAIVIGVCALTLDHRVFLLLGAVALVATSAIGFFHAGVELGFWEGPSSCTGLGTALTGQSGAELLSTDTSDVLVMCDQISWSLFGISMAGWNGIVSAVLSLLWARLYLIDMRADA